MHILLFHKWHRVYQKIYLLFIGCSWFISYNSSSYNSLNSQNSRYWNQVADFIHSLPIQLADTDCRFWLCIRYWKHIVSPKFKIDLIWISIFYNRCAKIFLPSDRWDESKSHRMRHHFLSHLDFACIWLHVTFWAISPYPLYLSIMMERSLILIQFSWILTVFMKEFENKNSFIIMAFQATEERNSGWEGVNGSTWTQQIAGCSLHFFHPRVFSRLYIKKLTIISQIVVKTHPEIHHHCGFHDFEIESWANLSYTA